MEEQETWVLESLLGNLEDASVLLRHPREAAGMVVYANRDFVQVHPLHSPVATTMVVAPQLMLRPVLYDLARTVHYWMVHLGNTHIRLYKGCQGILHEMFRFGFPIVRDGHSSLKDTLLLTQEAFMWPLVVAGYAEDLQEIAGLPDVQPWRTTLTTPWDSLQDVMREVWTGIQGQFAFERRQRNLKIVQDSQGKTLQEVPEILEASQSHPGALLLVRDDVGAYSQGSEGLTPGSKVTLDEVMRCVLRSGGEVDFLEPEVMPGNADVLLALRD